VDINFNLEGMIIMDTIQLNDQVSENPQYSDLELGIIRETSLQNQPFEQCNEPDGDGGFDDCISE